MGGGIDDRPRRFEPTAAGHVEIHEHDVRTGRARQPDGARRGELLRAVRAVAAGEAIFGPGVARRMLAWFARPRPGIDATPFPELTDREREILDLVASGASNTDITDRLVLSPKTVRNHISNIFSKLQVRDRAEAIVRAREAGMGGAEQGR